MGCVSLLNPFNNVRPSCFSSLSKRGRQAGEAAVFYILALTPPASGIAASLEHTVHYHMLSDSCHDFGCKTSSVAVLQKSMWKLL